MQWDCTYLPLSHTFPKVIRWQILYTPLTWVSEVHQGVLSISHQRELTKKKKNSYLIKTPFFVTEFPPVGHGNTYLWLLWYMSNMLIYQQVLHLYTYCRGTCWRTSSTSCTTFKSQLRDGLQRSCRRRRQRPGPVQRLEMVCCQACSPSAAEEQFTAYFVRTLCCGGGGGKNSWQQLRGGIIKTRADTGLPLSIIVLFVWVGVSYSFLLRNSLGFLCHVALHGKW